MNPLIEIHNNMLIDILKIKRITNKDKTKAKLLKYDRIPKKK